ncbi:MAG: nuclear transport factor 2 family protein, partial [Chloroflexia bacterium]|nr:nuclear transport factor 2 family protein [Chloroflexia bacterium]
PDPAECVVAPKPVAQIAAVLGTPVADPFPATPEPFVIPMGEPASDETAGAVIATLRQVFACANAGDPLRFSSLYSDDFLHGFFGGAPRADVIDFLSLPPQPLPEDQKRIIIRFGEVQMLPDGRAGVTIVLDEPDDPRTEEPDYAILERSDGRWLVDEIHEDGG